MSKLQRWEGLGLSRVSLGASWEGHRASRKGLRAWDGLRASWETDRQTDRQTERKKERKKETDRQRETKKQKVSSTFMLIKLSQERSGSPH